MRCWHSLASCRQVFPMGGMGSIPWPAVEDWGKAQGLDRESRQLLHAVIEHVEGERIRLENAKAKLNRATGGK